MRLLPLLLLLPLLAWAEAEEKEADSVPASAEPKEESDENKPEAEQLRSRDLGSAFKNFRPSEEISADNAVSFPVDI